VVVVVLVDVVDVDEVVVLVVVDVELGGVVVVVVGVGCSVVEVGNATTSEVVVAVDAGVSAGCDGDAPCDSTVELHAAAITQIMPRSGRARQSITLRPYRAIGALPRHRSQATV
jgi:hypothetical protein